MSLESELSKLRHPSNSKNFPILGSVPPSREFKFPMTRFLESELGDEYADDDIALADSKEEIPSYYARVAEILFSDYSFRDKMMELTEFQFIANIPKHEMDFFTKVASALSDQKIAEARSDAPSWPIVLGLDVNKPTETGSSHKESGDTLGIWGTLVTKVFKRSQTRGPF